MRLNFYSRRRRFNKSLLGSHKNTLRSQKSQKHLPSTMYRVVSIIFLAELVHLAELEELEEIDF